MRSRICLLCLSCCLASSTYAVNLNLVNTGVAHQSSFLFSGFMRDTSTGTYYAARHYSGTTMNSFANTGSFVGNTSPGTTNLAGDHYGTYHAVRNGKLFARTGTTGESRVGRFDATTGALETTSVFSNYANQNGQATMNWGGFSAFNLFDDASGLWMLAQHNDTNWHILKLDSNLNILTDYTFGVASIGYAFVVNGNMFIGQGFNAPTFTSRVDLSTGLQSTVNFTFVGPSGGLYFSNMFYDSLGDRLYVSNAGTYPSDPGLWILDGAAGQLGVVPEPGTIAAVGLGLAALASRRRSKS